MHGATDWTDFLGALVGESISLSRAGGRAPDQRCGESLIPGNDLACRRFELGVEGRRIKVVVEFLFPSNVSSSSGTPVSSVLTIEKGRGRMVCAVSSGVVTA